MFRILPRLTVHGGVLGLTLLLSGCVVHDRRPVVVHREEPVYVEREPVIVHERREPVIIERDHWDHDRYRDRWDHRY